MKNISWLKKVAPTIWIENVTNKYSRSQVEAHQEIYKGGTKLWISYPKTQISYKSRKKQKISWILSLIDQIDRLRWTFTRFYPIFENKMIYFQIIIDSQFFWISVINSKTSELMSCQFHKVRFQIHFDCSDNNNIFQWWTKQKISAHYLQFTKSGFSRTSWRNYN